MPVSDATIRELHRLARGQIWDAGQYKEKDGDIIERSPDGHERVRFRTVPAAGTPAAMAGLVADWQHCLDERWVHPLIAMAAFNLDFLCIHPFRDGNGRVSRLALLLQSYQLGYAITPQQLPHPRECFCHFGCGQRPRYALAVQCPLHYAVLCVRSP
jgi:Fic family protein